MYICQLPESVQDEIKKDIESYINTYLLLEYTADEKQKIIESAMSEKLVNILDTDEGAIECGLSTKKYGKYL